jgi:type IV secretory pathway TraG/TraD family ATPase VirD4
MNFKNLQDQAIRDNKRSEMMLMSYAWLAFVSSSFFLQHLWLQLPIIGGTAFVLYAPLALWLGAILMGAKSAQAAAAWIATPIGWILQIIGWPFWSRLQYLCMRRFKRIEDVIIAWIESRRSRSGDSVEKRLANGQRREAAEMVWPAEKFKHLYASLPVDLQRPLYEDGNLPGGMPFAMLADAAISRLTLRRAVRAGFAAFVVTFVLFAALFVFFAGTTIVGQLLAISVASELIEAWGTFEIRGDVFGQLIAAGWHVLKSLLEMVMSLGLGLLIAPLLAIGMAGLAFAAYIGKTYKDSLKKYGFPTKDALARAEQRVEQRTQAEASFAEAAELVTTRLADKKTITIGTATGTSRLRGVLFAHSSLTPVAFDEDGIAEGISLIGSTGSGKSSVIKNVLYTILSWADPTWSAFVQDGKGVLHADVRNKLQKIGRNIVTIGTAEGQKGVNLLSFMSPLEASEAMRGLSRQMADEKNVWSEQATQLFRHALVIASVWRKTEGGKVFKEKVADPYSMFGGYQLALDTKLQDRAIAEINDCIIGNPQFALENGSIDLDSSRHYLSVVWPTFHDETRSSVLFSLDALLGELAANEDLYTRFFIGRDTETVDFSDLFDGSGTVYLSAVGGAEHGKSGRMINMMLNAIFVKLAAQRQKDIGEIEAKAMPIIAIVDECHLTLSMDKEAAGSDVPSFLSITRSSGVAWLLSTQSVDQLYSSFGEHAAKTLLANLRNKIFLSTENVETIRFITDLGGETTRAFAHEIGARETIDHRVELDGFKPEQHAQWLKRPTLSDIGYEATLSAVLGMPQDETKFSFSGFMQFLKGTGDGKNTDTNREEAVRRGTTRDALYHREDVLRLGDYHAIVFVRRGRNLFTDKISVKHVFE